MSKVAENKKFKRRIEGVVVKDGNDKTIVVNVVRRFKHQKYSKFVHVSDKYHAHDERNEAKVGDKVILIESRPMSKMKRWSLIRVQQ